MTTEIKQDTQQDKSARVSEEIKQSTPQQNDVLRSGSTSPDADKSARVSEDDAQKIVGKEYTDNNGKKYTYRLSQGKRVLKDGKIITFDYKKIYYIRDNGLKRGPKTMTNKKQLRELLTKLSDAKCAEILQYVNEKYIKENNLF